MFSFPTATEHSGQLPEAVIQRCSVKKVFLEILQNCQGLSF